MKSARQQQLLSLIKRTISRELLDMNHELFHTVIITDVLLSNDGRICRIWVDAPEEIIKELSTTYRQELHQRFMSHYARKIIPRLIFIRDTGEIDRMEKLLTELESSHDKE